MTITLEQAMAVHDLGLAVQPPKEDGSKRPDGPWRQYENIRPTAETVAAWYANGRDGIGVITGKASDNLEMIELEGGAVREGMLEALYDRAEEWGLDKLLYRVIGAYLEKSPTGGVHGFFRVDGVAKGNTKLARRELGRDANGVMQVETLIETRGQGGFAILAPSGGKVHETGGPYERVHGHLADIVTVTEAERDDLHRLAASFDEMPKTAPPAEPVMDTVDFGFTTVQTGWFDQVVDDFNARTTWASVLVGWSHSHDHGAISYWVRPGKDPKLGHSATTNGKGTDRLTVFSSSVAGFESYDGVSKTTTYDRFSATAVLEYGGDRMEAARALRTAGYGPPADVRNTTKIRDPGPTGTTSDTGWPTLHPDAMHGPCGDYVRAAAPHTEADPVAILAQLLTGVGCIANKGPHMMAGNDRHPAAVFTAIVGATAKGKKGTSWAAARIVLERMDHGFTSTRILGGFGSGEILVETIAGGKDDDDDDDGFHETRDTRTLVQEGELASILAVAGRDSSTLAATIRNGWDGKTLSARTRGKGTAVATDYHLSIIGHITLQELRGTLSDKDTFGGTTNRFLWVAAKRARLLPDGGNIPDEIAAQAAQTLMANVVKARRHSLYKRTPAATKRWHELYQLMADDEPAGLLGAAIARSESQVSRISLAYAIADGSDVVDLVHVEAAWALWLYCRATAAMIFPPASTVAEPLLEVITAAGEKGVARRELHATLGRNATGNAIDDAIKAMVVAGLVVEKEGPTGEKGGRRPRIVMLAEYADDHSE